MKLNAETTSKDTHISNNNIEQVSSPKQSILTDTPSDIHLINKREPIALEQLDTSSSIDDNISVCDFKDQIMPLNAEIEALKSFFLEQIFVVKTSLEEKHQSAGDCNHVESLKEEIKYFREENQMKIFIIKTMSKKEKSLAQCLHSIIALILQSSKGNLKSNSPSKSDSSEFWSNVVEVSKENSCDKLPTIHSDNEHQKRSTNVVVSKESPNSHDIRNNSRNKNTKDIKKVYVVGDNMVKHVQEWYIIKRIDCKRKVYVRQFSGSKVDCMKDYMKLCIRENDLDHLIFHVRTNDVPSNIKAKCIAESIVSLANKVKASKLNVSIFSITPRNDNWNNKVMEVNIYLKDLYESNYIPFISNTTINSKKHLNNRRLHLNPKGSKKLGGNFLMYLKGLTS